MSSSREMDNENVVYIQDRNIFSYKEWQNYNIGRKDDRVRKYYIEWGNPYLERYKIIFFNMQIPVSNFYISSYM